MLKLLTSHIAQKRTCEIKIYIVSQFQKTTHFNNKFFIIRSLFKDTY